MVSVSLCLYSFLCILTLFVCRCNNLLRDSDATSFPRDSRCDQAMFISPGVDNIRNKCIDGGKFRSRGQAPASASTAQHTSFIMQNSSVKRRAGADGLLSLRVSLFVFVLSLSFFISFFPLFIVAPVSYPLPLTFPSATFIPSIIAHLFERPQIGD